MRAIDRRPAEEDKDRITGVVRSNLQRRISTPMSLRTYKTVSDTERLSARMTKASYINLTEGTHAAQLYTNQHIPGYRLDTQLTDEHGAVFYNRTTNDLRVAYRGTQTNFDWTTNLRMATATRIVLPNAQHPKVIANFMESAMPIRPNPQLSREDVIRTNVMKQVTTRPTKFRMLPLLDPNEYRAVKAGFDLKASRAALPKKKEMPMCTLVHQFE